MIGASGSPGIEGTAGGIGLTLERYDYTPFGRPIAQPMGDINGDGVVDEDDGNAITAARTAYSASSGDYDPRADLDHDGDVDEDDYNRWKTTPRVGWVDIEGYADGKHHLSYGDGFNSAVGLDMRIGYRGYVWDPKLGMYHVRNRVYDPVAQRFIQPDPIGDAGGDHNWYRYVQNHPWAEYDPMGLWEWDNGWIQYGFGGLLGFHGSQVANDGWAEGGRGAQAVARGVGHAATELYLTGKDVVVGAFDIRYQNQSAMMRQYFYANSDAERDAMASQNRSNAVRSLATLGLVDVIEGSMDFIRTEDTNALGMRMGGVIFQNVTIVVGEAGAKFVKDATGKIIARISEDGKVEAVGDSGTAIQDGGTCSPGEAHNAANYARYKAQLTEEAGLLNRSVNWVDENATMPPNALEYQSSAAGARSNPLTGEPQAPSIPTLNINGVRLVRFDEEIVNALVDRKWSIVPSGKTKLQALRQSIALRQAGLQGIWEVRNASEAMRAQRLLSNLGINNIEIKVVPP